MRRKPRTQALVAGSQVRIQISLYEGRQIIALPPGADGNANNIVSQQQSKQRLKSAQETIFLRLGAKIGIISRPCPRKKRAQARGIKNCFESTDRAAVQTPGESGQLSLFGGYVPLVKLQLGRQGSVVDGQNTVTRSIGSLSKEAYRRVHENARLVALDSLPQQVAVFVVELQAYEKDAFRLVYSFVKNLASWVEITP